MVINQLAQAHKDSKNADLKHQQSLEMQQELFELNSKIFLFKERFEVARSVLQFAADAASHQFGDAAIQKSSLIFLQVLYLFPDIPDIGNKVDEILQTAESLVKSRGPKTLKLGAGPQKFDDPEKIFMKLKDQCKSLNLAFEEYLLMPLVMKKSKHST